MNDPPKPGDECPECHGGQVYDDAGVIICVECDTRWDPKGLDADWQEPLKED